MSRGSVAAAAVFIGVVISGLSAKATTYYVAKTGSDSNACSQASPCVTIAHAYGIANPGDVIIVGPGTYSESLTLNKTGSSGSPITIQGFPVGGGCATTPQTDPENPIGTRPAPTAFITGATLSAAYNTLDCFNINHGVSISGSNTRFQHNYVDGTNSGDGSYGLYIDNGTALGPTGVYIGNNYFTLFEYGMMLRVSNSTFESNEIDKMQYSGVAGDCDYSRLWGDSDTFRHSYYHGMNKSTMCVAAQPHVDCVQSFYYSPGYVQASNMTFDGNTCDSFDEGFMLSNTGATSNYYGTWTVTNSLYVNSAIWCGVFDSQNFTVVYENNTCSGGQIVIRDSWGSGGSTLKAVNNIFTGMSSYLAGSYYTSQGGGSIVNSGHNLQYDSGHTLSQPNDILNVNPKLVSPSTTSGTGDYRLQASSPATGQAINVGLTTDHDGNARPSGSTGTGYDIGAYQYTATTVQTPTAPTGLAATAQ